MLYLLRAVPGVCPTRALTMTHEYELADDDRPLIFEKSDLLAPLADSMAPPPHDMVAGLDARDYYDGR